MKTVLAAVLAVSSSVAVASDITNAQELAFGYLNPTGQPYEGGSTTWSISNANNFTPPAWYAEGSQLQAIAQGNLDYLKEVSPEAWAHAVSGNDITAASILFNSGVLNSANLNTIQLYTVAEGFTPVGELFGE